MQFFLINFLPSPCSVITLVILPFPYPVKIALLPGGLYVIAVQGPRERAAEPEEDGDETRLKELEGGENVQIEPRPSVAVKEALEPRAKAVLEKPVNGGCGGGGVLIGC